ncbi:MAG: Gldg family protein, partial [Bacteroidota bacterium]
KFSDEEKYQIDQYLMRGGRIALFLNKVQANLQSQRASVLSLNLDDLLEAYGVRVNSDLVRDVRCAEISVTQQLGFMTIQNRIPYPYLPIASEFNPASMVVKDLRSVLLFFASSIDTTLAQSKGLDLKVLASTSKRSGKQEGFFLLDPTQEFSEEMFKESHLPVAVSLEGKFRSLYADTAITSDTVSTLVGTKLTESPPTRILVVGDGDFVQDQYLGQRDNITFANNVVDWLIDDIGLTQIRSRTIAAKRLEEISSSTKTVLKYINMVLPPFAVVVGGIVRWRMRIARRKTLQMVT